MAQLRATPTRQLILVLTFTRRAYRVLKGRIKEYRELRGRVLLSRTKLEVSLMARTGPTAMA